MSKWHATACKLMQFTLTKQTLTSGGRKNKIPRQRTYSPQDNKDSFLKITSIRSLPEHRATF